METTRTASNEPQLPESGPTTGRSAAAMATGDMAGGGAGEGERGPDSVLPSSPWVALLSVVGSHIARPEFQRKPRSHAPRAAPARPWGSKFPALPPVAPAKMKPTRKVRHKRRQRVHRAPPLPAAAMKRLAKKRARVCTLCGTTQTPSWRTSPADRLVMLCNACGIRARTSGAAPPEQVHVHVHLPTPATTVVVSDLEQPPPLEILHGSEYEHLPTAATVVVSAQEQPPPQEEIQQRSESPPDSPYLNSMLDFDVYLLKRTHPRRREKSPPPPPPTAGITAAALAPPPSGKKDKQKKKWCLHCGTTWSLQWRTGPMGVSTLCNACGVRYRQGRLVPEYRPRASPTFDQSEHSYKHRKVLQLREMQDRPAPPAAFRPSGNRKKRRKGKEQQQHQPAQARSRSEEQDQQPAQPAAVAVLQVRKKSDKGKAQRLPDPQPALRLKLRKELRGKQQHLLPPLPPPPPPPALPPHAGYDYDMVQQHLPPSPPVHPDPHAGYDMLHPHAGYDMLQSSYSYLPLPPALQHAAGDDDDMEMEQQHLVLLPPAAFLLRAGDEMAQYLPPPPPPPELPHAAADDDMEMEWRLLSLPPALPHATDELMVGEPMPIPPLDPFLFDGPAAPRIIDDDDDDEPATVIVIDDDEPAPVIVVDDDDDDVPVTVIVVDDD
jgi:GATA-binding protein, other eukaryote